ncbi:MAG: glutathione-dependent disulfide-bond oxidoreductase [Sphingomonadaceae bacterium]
MAEDDYTLPDVWTWEQPKEKHMFSSLNRPVSGATHETTLPRGDHPIQLYSMGTPNGQKATILLEELLAAGHAGAEYDAWLIDILKADQFGSGFVSVNPNSKIPGLIDTSGEKDVRVFESGAIMLYLAEKFGAFIPADPVQRGECYSWLMWQMSTAPILGGGFGHFFKIAPVKIKYAVDRFTMEAKRIFDVADKRLGEARFFAGDEYSIADMAIFGWFHYFVANNAYDGATKFLDIPSYSNVIRWNAEVSARVPVQRGLKVNLPMEGGVRERHSAADIDAEMG